MSPERRVLPDTPTQWSYWAALLCAALVATLAPWYLGVVDIDIRPTLRALLTGGALALALMQLDLAKHGEFAAAAPHLLGVIVLGAAWYLLGTFNVTGFLILFVVPTYAVALECDRWTVLGVATLTVVVATIAAVTANSELRWQLEQIDWFANLLPHSLAGGLDDPRFASSTAGREQLATLAVFAVTIVAVAGIGSSAAGVIRRQARSLQRTDRAHRESASLVSKLLDDSHTMEAIVSPASARIQSANRAFRENLGDAGVGANLVELLRPLYPEPLTQLLTAETGGVLASQSCSLPGERWLLDFDVQPVVLDGEPMRRVQLRRTAANDLAAAALDELDLAVLILSPGRKVAFANDAFRIYFPRATGDASADDALGDQRGLPAHWWEIAPSRRSQVRFRHDSEQCVARIVLTSAHAEAALTLIEIRVEHAA
jgi:hypothetical protein